MKKWMGHLQRHIMATEGFVTEKAETPQKLHYFLQHNNNGGQWVSTAT